MISLLPAEGVDELHWSKSSYSSNSSEADCVEVATAPGTVHVRDSKDVRGPRLGFAPTTWEAFVTYASEELTPGVPDNGSAAVAYVRFQSPHRNPRGHFTGVFGLVNNLAREGRLSDEQESFRRRNNSWYDAAYTDPSTVDPAVYDDGINPGAAAWFKPSAAHLLTRVPGYLEILAAHGVDCLTLRSGDPGRVVYEDDVQVVVVPYA